MPFMCERLAERFRDCAWAGSQRVISRSAFALPIGLDELPAPMDDRHCVQQRMKSGVSALRTAARALAASHRSEPETVLSDAVGRSARRGKQLPRR